MVFKVLIAAAFVAAAGVSAVEPEMIGKDLTLSCPLLTCDGNISPGTCYEHDGGASAKRIKGALCYDEDTAKQTDKQLVCPFNTKNFMWIDELYQGQADKLPSIVYDRDHSQVEGRQKTAICKDAGYLKQMMNPGRSCSLPEQCKSFNCEDKICQGNDVKVTCSSHEDCDPGLYCDDTLVWPFKSVCKEYRLANDTIGCTEDYQCEITSYCWFKSKEDTAKNRKSCMKMYSADIGTKFGWQQAAIGEGGTSATLDEYTQNGKFCKTGLAYQSAPNEATCTKTTKVTFGNEFKLTNAPYNCTATDPTKKCQIHFQTNTPITKDYFEVFCRCSMADSSVGYCESVIGTDVYVKAVEAKKLVYEKSNCHTLDREDLRAQRDKCGIRSYTDEWRYAVDQQFNVTHWPYVQENKIYHCVQKFFADSYINLKLDAGLFGIAFSAMTFVAGLQILVI